MARAEYLLALAGGPGASQDKTVPKNLLGEVLMFREEIDEAIASSDTAALEALKQQITADHDQVLRVIAGLAGSLDETHPENRRKLREQLNAIKYFKNLLDQIPAGAAG